jgi:hypothetical protein
MGRIWEACVVLVGCAHEAIAAHDKIFQRLQVEQVKWETNTKIDLHEYCNS